MTALTGILIGIPLSALLNQLFDKAEQADLHDRIKTLNKQLEETEQRIREEYNTEYNRLKDTVQADYDKHKRLYINIEKKLQVRSETLEKDENKIKSDRHELDEAITAVNELVADWQQGIDKAEQKKQEAYARSKNSRAAAERYKRKAEKWKRLYEEEPAKNTHHKIQTKKISTSGAPTH
ncbi:hypothetical protein CI610_03046 [invertebrate metagenome]|uniref:Uncharacterized protein n=1 Tax=invertebrate metagenome TaxID=1711999 RepID=A0A2H9T458_9ZZZZ